MIKILNKFNIDCYCDGDPDEVFKYLCLDKKADHDMIDVIKVDKIGEAKIVKSKIDDLRKYL